MKILYLILLFSFFSYEELKGESIKIKEIWVYNYLDSNGNSLGEVYRQFEILGKKNTSMFSLDTLDIGYLQLIMQDIKPKRQFIGKLGSNSIYGVIITENNLTLKYVISEKIIISFNYNNIKGKNEYYWIKKNKIEYWYSFIEKIRQKIRSNISD